MTIVFISNFINHYMAPLIEELNKINGCRAFFVETVQLPDSLRKGGFRVFQEEPYLIKAWQNESSRQKMEELAHEADVLILGSGFKMLELKRLRQGKLTFEMSERPLKRGLINLFSPRIFLTQLFYHLFFYNKPLYMLCFSAFTAVDEYKLHAFKDKCYKFGYFPRIPECDIEKVLSSKPNGKIRIIWCARFIKWKHPELAIRLAERLVKDGYDFEINMIGSGILYDKINNMIREKGLSDYVHLLGNYPNDDVLKMMSRHHVFLFTSDKNEGWGVVLNEAMGQGCCPIAADEIGAVPFLLKDNYNGKVFKSNSLDALYVCTKELLDNPCQIMDYARNAYNTVKNVWNPVIAAQRLYGLSDVLLNNKLSNILDGPCSSAKS